MLVRLETTALIKPGDRAIIREVLKSHIARTGVRFQYLDWEWGVGRKTYLSKRGFGYLHKLLSHPGEKIHVDTLTHQSQPSAQSVDEAVRETENSRKAAQKVLKRAVGVLTDTQPEIGLHLQSHIETGEYCVYTGDWDWLL